MVKLLIVDDSNFSQKVTANLLKKYLKEVEIFFASDGEEGFLKYKEIKPDYIFIDLLMPKINGKELIQLLRAYDTEVKIVVVSADIQKSVREEIEAYNVLSFINKPFNDEKAEVISKMIKDDVYE